MEPGSLDDLADERLNHRVEVETESWKSIAAIMQTSSAQGRERKKQAKLLWAETQNKNRTFANQTNYDIIPYQTTVLREAGQEESSSLSEVNCVLFSNMMNRPGTQMNLRAWMQFSR